MADLANSQANIRSRTGLSRQLQVDRTDLPPDPSRGGFPALVSTTSHYDVLHAWRGRHSKLGVLHAKHKKMVAQRRPLQDDWR